MNLRLPNNPKRRRSRNNIPRAFFIVSGVVLILIFFNSVAFNIVSRTAQVFARPLWVGEAKISNSLSIFFQSLGSKQALVEENERLRQEIAGLKLLDVTAQVVQQENETLREVCLRNDTVERIAGAVITRPDRSAYDTFVVDIGWQHGVKQSSRVFSNGNILIGDIAEVYAKTALVQLYSTPGVVTSVVVGEKATPAEAVGRGGGNFEITLPRGIEIAEGDSVSAPSLGGGALGVVGEVILNPTDSFQTVLLRGPINIQSLRIVTVEL
jgi:cell shape-determining protein MreC